MQKIILKNGKVLKSRYLVDDKETKINFQSCLKEGMKEELKGTIQIGKLILRVEDISAFCFLDSLKILTFYS